LVYLKTRKIARQGHEGTTLLTKAGVPVMGFDLKCWYARISYLHVESQTICRSRTRY